ncbi:hypothetical protein CXB51_035574 [Gossypium anomalum]|uniref:Uncharacterized protein n=1 Tax=Gossypium anomalum TaxID=47600 RepID=A0A8J5XPP7_9ROSI|nr:hypothetical protein CXB51_035574 [Gossypium anomalum]
MHLWPSVRLRDSFKIAYLRKLEWNLHRMKSEKQSSSSSPRIPSNQQNLLNDDQEATHSKSAPSKCCASFIVIGREIFMVLSCCYCCFCCGVSLAKKQRYWKKPPVSSFSTLLFFQSSMVSGIAFETFVALVIPLVSMKKITDGICFRRRIRVPWLQNCTKMKYKEKLSPFVDSIRNAFHNWWKLSFLQGFIVKNGVVKVDRTNRLNQKLV